MPPTATGGTATTTAPTPTAAPAASRPGAAVLADAAALRDTICACRDEDCLRAPSAAYGTFFSRHAEADLEAASWDLAPIATTIDYCQARVRQDTLADQAVATFVATADAMCACKDKACTDRVNADLEAAMERYKDVKGTEAQARSLEPVMQRYMQCSMSAMGASPGAGASNANGKPSR